MKYLELYIHTPFCVRKCEYCDFLSFAADSRTQAQYIHALLEEIRFYGACMREYQVSTIYIGGGTPSWLEAEMIVSVMNTVYQSFSVTVDVLKGSFSPTVVAKSYDKLKTFGVGRDVPANDWHAYLLQMLQMGYIEIAYNEDKHLKVTPLGEDILYGRKQAQLSVIVREDLRVTKRKRKKTNSESSMNIFSDDELLFEKLRTLRKTIADEIGKPAYIVLSDKSLRSLVSEKPTSLSLFGNTYGIGEYKKMQFGERFVDLICSHLEVSHSPEPVTSSVQNQTEEEKVDVISSFNPELSYMDRQKQLYSMAYAPWTEEEEKALLYLHKQGKKISELTDIFHRNAGAIRSRLKRLGEL